MTATLPCQRCATDMHVVTEQGSTGTVFLRVIPHECYRYLVGEFWDRGEPTSRWTSDRPGRSGPPGFVLDHGADADRGWLPPKKPMGWTYRWMLGYPDPSDTGDHT